MKCGAAEIVVQYGVVTIAACTHYGRTYLTQTDTMSPAGTDERELPFGIFIDHKGRTIEVRWRKPFAYLEFLANDERALRANDFQPHYLPVDKYGIVSPETVEAAIRPDAPRFIGIKSVMTPKSMPERRCTKSDNSVAE